MNEKAPLPAPVAPGLKIGDIYYVLFRHKWKIIILSLLGIVASAYYFFYFSQDRTYYARAKLMVKYIIENKGPIAGAGAEGTKTPKENPLANEVQILESFDVARSAAESLTLDDLKSLGSTNVVEAAGAIRSGLRTGNPSGSSVIEVQFEHSKAEVVTPVLASVIAAYRAKHVDIHKDVGVFDVFLETRTDELRRALQSTEKLLKDRKSGIGVVSLDETRKGLAEAASRLGQTIFEVETQLAVATNAFRLASLGEKTEETGLPSLVTPADKADEYHRLRARYENLVKKEQELLGPYTDASKLVISVREQMAETRKSLDDLETAYPGLLVVRTAASGSQGRVEDLRNDPAAQMALTNALYTRLVLLKGRYSQIMEQAKTVEEAEIDINELQRQKELQEAQYKYFEANLAQLKSDQQLGNLRSANISIIQKPAGAGDNTLKRRKTAAALLLVPIGSSLLLAFLLEMFVDRSFRRPTEAENQLGIPLFLSIPKLRLNGSAKALLGNGAQRQIAAGAGSTSQEVAKANGNGHAGWEPDPTLRPFADTLRDRLITFFEVKNMTHKPKLVAVTSCSEGAGVSTVSASLAAALSETGEGNVLLVDMNQRNGAAHQFHKGALACGIDEALEKDRRDDALVQDNLYVVSENKSGEKPSTILPQRFKNLVPRLKASDYDYIIFDMPAVSQISMTPRLAKFMDMVLMVVESEKTDRDVVKRASALLAESRTHVGVVLNKARNYVPRRLRQELA